MDMVDTSKDIGKGMLSLYNRFDNIKLKGYIQPQFQISSSKGAKGFSEGDFSPYSSECFMLRRARVRFDYIHFPKVSSGTISRPINANSGCIFQHPINNSSNH